MLTFKGQLVNDEILLTFMVETKRLLNSRSLTHVGVDPRDLEPITLNNLLLRRSSSNVLHDVFHERVKFQKAVETSPDLNWTFLEKMVKGICPYPN